VVSKHTVALRRVFGSDDVASVDRVLAGAFWRPSSGARAGRAVVADLAAARSRAVLAAARAGHTPAPPTRST
jgi:hypothetical protein